MSGGSTGNLPAVERPPDVDPLAPSNPVPQHPNASTLRRGQVRREGRTRGAVRADRAHVVPPRHQHHGRVNIPRSPFLPSDSPRVDHSRELSNVLDGSSGDDLLATGPF